MSIVSWPMSFALILTFANISLAAEECNIEQSSDAHIISKADDQKIVSSVIDGEIGVRSKVTMKISLCDMPKNAEILKVDAIMPLHRHGMNYEPKIEKINDNQFIAQPYVFHMPGTWQLQTRVSINGEILEFKGDFNISP